MTWRDLHRTLILSLLIVQAFYSELCTCLQCYECNEEFKQIWKPSLCQLNATQSPLRECNLDQNFCFVERVTVKGFVTKITRNCVQECFYGCIVSNFGITSLSCTSCCNTDYCNTGNRGVSHTRINLDMLCVAVSPLFALYHLWHRNRVT